MAHFRVLFSAALVVVGLASLATLDVGSADAPQPDSDARTIAAFSRAVDGYAALHRALEQTSPPIALSGDPAEISRATSALREKIRATRRDAREGDVFNPHAATLFRRLIARGCDRDFDALLKETADEAERLGRATVNERWPGAALTMMPPDLLALFPPLPRELQYRFVHHDLVLWDMDVDLIVDVLRDAIPPSGENPA